METSQRGFQHSSQPIVPDIWRFLKQFVFIPADASFLRIRTKIKGAVEHCKAKRLTKQCPYEEKTKFLVLTSDKVENLAFIYIYISLSL